MTTNAYCEKHGWPAGMGEPCPDCIALASAEAERDYFKAERDLLLLQNGELRAALERIAKTEAAPSESNALVREMRGIAKKAIAEKPSQEPLKCEVCYGPGRPMCAGVHGCYCRCHGGTVIETRFDGCAKCGRTWDDIQASRVHGCSTGSGFTLKPKCDWTELDQKNATDHMEKRIDLCPKCGLGRHDISGCSMISGGIGQ